MIVQTPDPIVGTGAARFPDSPHRLTVIGGTAAGSAPKSIITSSSNVHEPTTTDQRIVYAPANEGLAIEKVVIGLLAVNVGAGRPAGTLET
jgi:hypothetical protein